MYLPENNVYFKLIVVSMLYNYNMLKTLKCT